MNLNKLKLLALLLPVIALSGCEEWKPDQALVENLWKETVKVTGLPTETLMPRVKFLPYYDPEKKGCLGRCYYGNDKRLEIYIGEHIHNVWEYRDGKYGPGYRDVGYKEGEALIYNTVAHEMLHYALFLQEMPSCHQHKAMKDCGYLEQLTDFVSQYFQLNPDGFQKEITMDRLEHCISKDQE